MNGFYLRYLFQLCTPNEYVFTLKSIYLRTNYVTGTVVLPGGTEMVMPGDNLEFTVELIAPIAMEEKLRVAIREGGRKVGSCVIAKITE